MILETEFPGANLTVKPISGSILISGYVEHPEDVAKVREIAEQYYPKVLTNLRVSGVQQVLLHVKAMEVSRTKLRSLGLDWSSFSPNTVIQSMGAGVLSSVTRGVGALPGGGQTFDYSIGTTGSETFRLSIINGDDAFFAVLDALRRDSLAQVLAEPTLVTVSGRPAFFQVGGEVPTLAPAGLGTVSVEYKRYGTQVDFVPIVLGNGRIRLEVRPRVSDIDLARSITVNGQTIYAFNTREVDTGVELEAGQTLAIAGLVQTRVEAERRGIPFLSELPLVGIPFRKVSERTNEVELLILVTPELVEALNPDQVPKEGPGLLSDRPTDWQFYVRGFLEVPRQSEGCSPEGDVNGTPGLLIPARRNLQAARSTSDCRTLWRGGGIKAAGGMGYLRPPSDPAAGARPTASQPAESLPARGLGSVPGVANAWGPGRVLLDPSTPAKRYIRQSRRFYSPEFHAVPTASGPAGYEVR